MDYVSNGTLFNMIKKWKGMDEKTAFKYFIHTAAAVNFLHENNLVHRDLKPENLLIDEYDNVKLCDFGWCVELAVGNRSTFCGTYEYMAPEIINESPYNSGIDVWSLGVLLYELLHGYSPFRAKTNKNTETEYIEIFKNIVKYNFKIEKDLSDSCADLIKKLLSPELKNRIKVRDIFFHPWVVSFEQEYKEQRLKQARGSESKKEVKEPQSVSTDVSKQSENYKSNDNVDNSFKNNSKNSIKVEPEKPKEIASEGLGKDKLIKEALNQQKANQIDKLINNKQNEFSLLEGGNKDSLFDKVLNQVQEKNKSKKKRNKPDELQKESSGIMNSSSNINNTSQSENKNKISIVAEKPLIEEKKPVEEPPKAQPPKKNMDQNNFSILNEISDFENKLNEVENKKKINDSRKNMLKVKEDSQPVVVIPLPKKQNQGSAFKENKLQKEDFNEFNLIDEKFDVQKDKRKPDKFVSEFDDFPSDYKKNNQSKNQDSDVYRKNLVGNDKNAKDFEKAFREKESKNKIKNQVEDQDNEFYMVESSFKEDMKKHVKDREREKENKNTPVNNNSPYKDKYEQPSGVRSHRERDQKLNKEQYEKNNNSKNLPANNKKNGYDKGVKKNNFEVDPDRKKNIDKELDLSFLPKDLLYNERTYGESKNNLLAAIEILEKAQENKNQVQKQEKPQESKSFWSFMNPFKCGNNN